MAVSKKSVVDQSTPLSDAKIVGTYVAGSSSGSRYVCVLVGANLNLAVRISPDHTVSARVESPNGAIVNVGPLLEKLGFTMHGDKYASAHTKAIDDLRASMGVAAYIVGIMALAGPCTAMPYADLLTLPGKGA